MTYIRIQYRKAGEMAFVSCLCVGKDEMLVVCDKIIGREAREFCLFLSLNLAVLAGEHCPESQEGGMKPMYYA